MRVKGNIKIYESDEEKKTAADIALKHKLYVSGWLLSSELVKARKCPDYVKNIALCYKENKPIGVIITTCNNMLQVFVRKNQRKQGVGSKLIKSVKTKKSWARTGLDREGKVWKYNEVKIR